MQVANLIPNASIMQCSSSWYKNTTNICKQHRSKHYIIVDNL